MEGGAAHAPAVAGIHLLMDMGLIEIDQLVPIPLRAVEQRAEVLDEPYPLRGIGTSQQLAGFLPGQFEPVQGRADGLAAQQAIEAVLHERNETLERPAGRRISPGYGRRGRGLLGGADRLVKRRCDPWTKGGRPPLRRYLSAAGPCWL